MLPFLLFSLLPLVSAASTFIACTSGGPPAGGELFVPFSTTPPTNGDLCTTACEEDSRTDRRILFPFYRDTDKRCLCSTLGPLASDVVEICDPSANRVTRIFTTFEMETCYPGTPPAGSLVTSDIRQCFERCRGDRTLDVYADTAGSVFRCACSTPQPNPNTATTCGPGTNRFYRYDHSAPAAASMLLKRRRINPRKEEDYCPGSLTACKVQGSSGYECIDTSSELESCGGCVHGRYLPVASTVTRASTAPSSIPPSLASPPAEPVAA